MEAARKQSGNTQGIKVGKDESGSSASSVEDKRSKMPCLDLAMMGDFQLRHSSSSSSLSTAGYQFEGGEGMGGSHEEMYQQQQQSGFEHLIIPETNHGGDGGGHIEAREDRSPVYFASQQKSAKHRSFNDEEVNFILDALTFDDLHSKMKLDGYDLTTTSNSKFLEKTVQFQDAADIDFEVPPISDSFSSMTSCSSSSSATSSSSKKKVARCYSRENSGSSISNKPLVKKRRSDQKPTIQQPPPATVSIVKTENTTTAMTSSSSSTTTATLGPFGTSSSRLPSSFQFLKRQNKRPWTQNEEKLVLLIVYWFVERDLKTISEICKRFMDRTNRSVDKKLKRLLNFDKWNGRVQSDIQASIRAICASSNVKLTREQANKLEEVKLEYGVAKYEQLRYEIIDN